MTLGLDCLRSLFQSNQCYDSISAPIHNRHKPKMITGKCCQLHSTLSISKLQFRSLILLVFHPDCFSVFLFFAHLQHCPITVSSCSSAYLPVAIWDADLDADLLLAMTSCPAHIVQICLVFCSLHLSMLLPSSANLDQFFLSTFHFPLHFYCKERQEALTGQGRVIAHLQLPAQCKSELKHEKSQTKWISEKSQ